MTLHRQLQHHAAEHRSLIVAALAGAAIGLAVPAVVGQSLYRLALIILTVVMTLGLVVSRAPQRTLIALIAFAIPLNLTFTPFGQPARWHPGGAQEVFVFYLYDFPLLALVALWALDLLINRRRLRASLAEIAPAALVVWSLLSIYNSANHALTLLEALRMVKLLLMAHIVAATITTDKGARAVVLALLAGLLLQSVFSVLQYGYAFDIGGLGFTVGDVRRVSGTVGWPNTLGAYAAAILCLPIALWTSRVFRGHSLLLVLAIIAGAAPLALSFSRGAWVALAVAVIIMYLLGLKRGWISIGRFITQVVVLVALAAAAGLLLVEQINDRSSQDTLSVREELNNVALNMVEAQPVLGIGLNTFVPAMRAYDPRNVSAYFPEPVHNIYLLVAAETGLVGLALFLATIVLLARDGLIVWRRGGRFVSALAIGLLGGLIAILVSNLTDVHLRTDVIYALWWLLAGLILALRRRLDAAPQAVTSPNAARRLRATL